MTQRLEKSLFDFGEWIQTEEGRTFQSRLRGIETTSLHLFNEQDYVVFTKSDIRRSWECAASLMRGFEENAEYLIEYLEEYPPAHIVCLREGPHLKGIKDLLLREPNLMISTRTYGKVDVFLNAHTVL